MKAPKLHGKKVSLVLGRGGSHWYRVGSQKELYPSVTTVTGAVLAKPALVPWAKKTALENVRRVLSEVKFNDNFNPINLDDGTIDKNWINGVIENSKKVPESIASEAADVGTRAHIAISQMLKGERDYNLDGIEEDIRNAVGAFLEWYPKSGIKILFSECCVASHSLKTGGSMDAFAKDEHGLNMVVDFKTSNGIYSEMAYQLGGYALCYEDMTGEEVPKGVIIRFAKKKEDKVQFEVRHVRDMAMAKMGFASAKILYDINKANILEVKQWEPEPKKLAKKAHVS